ncbi:MAG: UDP-diphosphatase [Acidimicrobiaceae bacterium]|nr:UDP-diphosphatase [Acidimicrobiaceae bacterium]|tara:strand:- start:2758 stop:3705 length:948 start_codon:yes stop_codon:yes gene_type:complete
MIKKRQEVTLRFGSAAIVLVLFFELFAGQASASNSATIAEGLVLWKAIVLGVVEGLTEFLPISSTGHLLAAKELMHLDSSEISEQAIDSYIISIQIGAILAIIVLYKNRIRQMYEGLRGQSEIGKVVLRNLVAAFVPTAIIGLLLADYVKDRLYESELVAYAWIVGGVFILFAHEKKLLKRDGLSMENLSIQGAIVVGLVQALALWPGVSRSLVTIFALVALGLSLAAAVEFSFLLGLITLAAATFYELSQDGGRIIEVFGYWTPLVGLIAAFLSAMASVKWMVSWLENKSFSVFGFYRVAIGILAISLLSTGVL